jgi:putative transposase
MEAPPQGLERGPGSDAQEGRDIWLSWGALPRVGGVARQPRRSKSTRARRPSAGGGERPQAWRPCFRRILVRWDKKPAHSLTFLQVAWALMAVQAAGLCG